MENLSAIGIFFGGLGLFLGSCGLFWWVSLYGKIKFPKNEKENNK